MEELGLRIDPEAERPLYRQIVDRLTERIEAGELPPGARLPTVRGLARGLAISRVTAHKVYIELQARGLVDSTVGRGTFVVGPPEPAGPVASKGSSGPPASALHGTGRVARSRRTISLATAEPDPALYPVAETAAILRGLLAEIPSMLRYGSPAGDPSLRHQVASILGKQGIRATPGEVLITSGASHALALVTEALTQPGDGVLVEQPTYFGFLALLKSRNLRPIGVPMGPQGPDPEALQRVAARERPRFFYTIPSFHNPTGISMPAKRRGEILAAARALDLTVVEDGTFQALPYDRDAPSSLKARDENGLVVHVGSFSKVLLPGLRIGFMVAPAPLRDRLSTLLQVGTLGSAPLLQRALGEFLRQGLLDKHLARVIPHYKERRDALLGALEESMPRGTRWTAPRGGFCCWITLPDGGAYEGLHEAALEAGVSYAPGELFLDQPDGRTHLRLCFGAQDPAAIRTAVHHLADLVRPRSSRAAADGRGAYRAAPLV